MLFLLSGCNKNLTESDNIKENFYNMSGKASSGIWLTFSEISAMLGSQKGFENELADINGGYVLKPNGILYRSGRSVKTNVL